MHIIFRIDEIIVGAPGYSENSSTNIGQIHIYINSSSDNVSFTGSDLCMFIYCSYIYGMAQLPVSRVKVIVGNHLSFLI